MDKVKSKYLQFSNQQLEALPEKATNFAILESEDLGELPLSIFTICGSIYIGFYRGKPTFYAVRRNDNNSLLFCLFIENQDTTEEVYTAGFTYFGGDVLSMTGGKLRLRPHAWSHACTTMDVVSGHVTVVINGILIINTTIISKDFTGNVPNIFQNNLVLGVRQTQYSGVLTNNYQSESSVTNVNVFSVPMNVSQMEDITSTGRWTDGDIVYWCEAVWTLSGNVRSVKNIEIENTSSFPNLFQMADGFHSAHDCMNLCPRIQAGGRLPFTRHATDAEHLAQLFYHPESHDWFWSPFIYQTEGNFVDYYSGAIMPPELWSPSQPNGGLQQQCTEWDRNRPNGILFDISCDFVGKKLNCLCQFDQNPILRVRGLCKGSNIDTHFTLKNLNENIVYMGVTGTVIRFLPSTQEWALNVTLSKTTGLTSAEEMSLILGRHDWSIDNDSAKCNNGRPYTTQLKMSGCKTDGEFTCDDGQCVTMEERCDQIPDCRDRSDEENCQLLVKVKGYNKEVPPFTVRATDRSIVPVQLNISIDLLKIVDMEETDHKIDFQFKITLEWKENNRVVFHNLKPDSSLNALSKDAINNLWLPLVFYDNTDQKEITRLGALWEWNTPVSVIREGNFTRSGLEVVDETEIFKGADNTLFMQQVYTWQFQCMYNLYDYPFDTQV